MRALHFYSISFDCTNILPSLSIYLVEKLQDFLFILIFSEIITTLTYVHNHMDNFYLCLLNHLPGSEVGIEDGVKRG